MPARPAGPLAACLCLLLACAPPATANGVGSGGTGRTGQVAAKALDGTDTDGASDTIPNSSCNGTSAAFEGTQPIPCTAQQEQDALNDLAADTPSPSPSPAAAGGGASPSGQLPPPLDVLSTSECNATDPDGYTIAVDLMDPDLIDVVAAVADAFVASEGNASYWQALCEGDYLPTPLNACQQPDVTDPATGEVRQTGVACRPARLPAAAVHTLRPGIKEVICARLSSLPPPHQCPGVSSARLPSTPSWHLQECSRPGPLQTCLSRQPARACPATTHCQAARSAHMLRPHDKAVAHIRAIARTVETSAAICPCSVGCAGGRHPLPRAHEPGMLAVQRRCCGARGRCLPAA
ncbi:hypothetical protein ABPG77_008770 [Micractinium sp. CCAP 211/92]